MYMYIEASNFNKGSKKEYGKIIDHLKKSRKETADATGMMGKTKRLTSKAGWQGIYFKFILKPQQTPIWETSGNEAEAWGFRWNCSYMWPLEEKRAMGED